MKLFIPIFFIAAIFFSGDCIAQKTAAPPVVKLKTKEDSAQYALGIYFGRFILQTGFVTLSPNIIMTGIDDVVRNKARQINDSMALPVIAGYLQGIQQSSFKKLEDQLFAALKDRPDAGRLPSGVQYIIRKASKGPRPSETDSVYINYKGILASGAMFEDTYSKKTVIATTPASVFPGLADALQMMPEGSIWELFIPSSMGYGEKGDGSVIPPNSALVMLVELVKVKRAG